MLLQILVYVLLLIILGIVVIDMVPVIIDWVGRIRIGRLEDKYLWNKAITNQGAKWLSKTPKIKVTDNTRLIVIDMMKGNYTNNAIQHWQEASLLLGLAEYLKYNDDESVKNEIMKFLTLKFDQNGQWKDKPEHVDGAILAYAVMNLNFQDSNKYRPALDYVWAMVKEHIGRDGTVEYRKFMKSYRYVDTIGFICPFLISYGLKYNNDECIELAVKQIKAFEKYGMFKDHYIPCHVYKIENQVPLGVYGWGRGLGWLAIGLIDAWNQLPQNHKYKLVLEEIVRRFAEAAIGFQQDNGSWNWTVTRDESRADSSATATLGWFMLNASNIKDISKECLDSTEKAMTYLMKVTRRNGAIDFSQGDTKDIGVYSSLFNILPFTQGFGIRCINLYIHKTKDTSKWGSKGYEEEVRLNENNRIHSYI